MVPPWVRRAGGTPAMMGAAGLDGAGCPAERRGKWGTSGGRGSGEGHDGCRERTRTWLGSSGLGQNVTIDSGVVNPSLGPRVARLGKPPVPYGEMIRRGWPEKRKIQAFDYSNQNETCSFFIPRGPDDYLERMGDIETRIILRSTVTKPCNVDRIFKRAWAHRILVWTTRTILADNLRKLFISDK